MPLGRHSGLAATGAGRRPALFHSHRFYLKIDVDRDTWTAGISAIEQVISITAVIDVNIVSLIPVTAPVLGVRVHHREPIAAVLEARIAALIREWEAIDAEEVTVAIVAAEVVLGNPVAMIAAALLPIPALVFPMIRSPLLPGTLLHAFLFMLLLLGALHLFLLSEMAAVVPWVLLPLALLRPVLIALALLWGGLLRVAPLLLSL